jgi:alkanesulfonate monooxygenase SsuD/methylene tetrahydromethanopterin reductase-like flavin-dependent oxidoreductase (luciferase family)
LATRQILLNDHYYTQAYDPLTLLSSAAATTSKIKLGTLVMANDFRHPANVAKSAAAAHILSKGRLELGMGTGWMKQDYDMAGIKPDSPIVRINRLEEASKIIKSMWINEKTTFHGKHYYIIEMDKAGDLSEGDCPKILVGG